MADTSLLFVRDFIPKRNEGGIEIQLFAHIIASAALAASWYLAFLPHHLTKEGDLLADPWVDY